MQNVPCHSAQRWLSYDIVRFKIEMGVEEKSKCKNAPKQTPQLSLCRWPPGRRHVLAAVHGTGAVDDLDFIGLCGSSNLLLFLFADERRAFLK